MIETIITLIITAVLLLLGVLFFFVLNTPIKTWYNGVVERSQTKAKPIKRFTLIDIFWATLSTAAIFFVFLGLAFGYMIATIIACIALLNRVFFYRATIARIFLDIFREKKTMKRDKLFNIVSLAMLLIFVAMVVIPILNLVARAFSDGRFNSQVTFVPIGFTFYSFNYILSSKPFWTAAGNSGIYVLLTTIISTLFAALAGYVLSKPDFPLRKTFLIIFIITMLFSPGIVPIYLMMNGLKLLNTQWSYILISFSSVFNMLLMKTAFEGVPTEIEESAQMDGCPPLRMFFQVVLPLIMPTIASCAFFSIVGAWNGYGGALMFVTSAHEEAMPLALYIYYLLEQLSNSNNLSQDAMIYAENIKAASIIITVLPILAIYPYIIQYIKTGITIGSVK